MNIKISLSEVMELFGVSDETVRQWTKLGMPKDGRRYDLKKVFDWWNENINETAGDESAKKAKIIYWKAKAKIEQLKEQNMRGKLVDIATVERDIANISAIYRGTLLSLRDRLPPLLEFRDRKEIRKILTEELDKVFEIYRKEIEKLSFNDVKTEEGAEGEEE